MWLVSSNLAQVTSTEAADISPGNIIRQAEQVGVPVPTVRIVYHALQEMNRQMEGLLSPQIPPIEYQSAHLTPLVRKPATTRGNIVQEQCGEAKPHSAC